MIKVSWTEHKTNEEVLQTVDIEIEVVDILRSRQKRWLGPGLEVRRYGPVWHTGTSLVGLKAYRHFFLARCHTGMP